MPVPTASRSKPRMPPRCDGTCGKSKHKSHRFVGAGAVDLRHRRSHGSQVCGDLPAVMNDVQEKSPGVLVADLIHHGLTAKQEWDRFFPSRRVDGLKSF